MRAIMVMTIVGLVVCGSLKAGFKEVAGEKTEDLLKKAGQDALSYYEGQLKEANAEIDAYIAEVGSDRVIAAKEMVGLEKKVGTLLKLGKETNEHLKIYNLAIDSELVEKIERKKEIISNYFKPLIRERDRDGSVRELFAQITGRDLKIKSRFNWDVFTGLLVGLVLFSIGVKIGRVDAFFLLLALIGAAVCGILLLVGLGGL